MLWLWFWIGSWQNVIAHAPSHHPVTLIYSTCRTTGVKNTEVTFPVRSEQLTKSALPITRCWGFFMTGIVHWETECISGVLALSFTITAEVLPILPHPHPQFNRLRWSTNIQYVEMLLIAEWPEGVNTRTVNWIENWRGTEPVNSTGGNESGSWNIALRL